MKRLRPVDRRKASSSPVSGTLLLVGLGNPGRRFDATRHNAGFALIDRFADERCLPLRKAFFRPYVFARSTRDGSDDSLVVCKPLTYMNRSGEILPDLLRRFSIDPERVCAVVDNMDLPPGEIRMKTRGSPSNHNGLRSIERALGNGSFPRIYIGVGRPESGTDVISYLLEPTDPAERIAIDGAIARLAALLDRTTDLSLPHLASAVNAIRRPTVTTDEPR